MFTYAKIIGVILFLIAGISIGYGLADMIKIKPLKAEVGKLSAQLESVISTNQRNDETVKQITNASQKMITSYEARLKLKDKKFNEMVAICNLPLSTGGSNAKENSSSPLLDRINSLYP